MLIIKISAGRMPLASVCCEKFVVCNAQTQNALNGSNAEENRQKVAPYSRYNNYTTTAETKAIPLNNGF